MGAESLLKRLMKTPRKEIEAELSALKKDRDEVLADYQSRIELLEILVQKQPAGDGRGNGQANDRGNGIGADPTSPGRSITDRVRNYLRDNGPATPSAIAAGLNLEWSQVQPVLYRLKETEVRQTASGWVLRGRQ